MQKSSVRQRGSSSESRFIDLLTKGGHRKFFKEKNQIKYGIHDYHYVSRNKDTWVATYQGSYQTQTYSPCAD